MKGRKGRKGGRRKGWGQGKERKKEGRKDRRKDEKKKEKKERQKDACVCRCCAVLQPLPYLATQHTHSPSQAGLSYRPPYRPSCLCHTSHLFPSLPVHPKHLTPLPLYHPFSHPCLQHMQPPCLAAPPSSTSSPPGVNVL